MGGQLGKYFYSLELILPNISLQLSLCCPDRAPCCLPTVRQLVVEWCFPHPDIRGERLERGRFLH